MPQRLHWHLDCGGELILLRYGHITLTQSLAPARAPPGFNCPAYIKRRACKLHGARQRGQRRECNEPSDSPSIYGTQTTNVFIACATGNVVEIFDIVSSTADTQSEQAQIRGGCPYWPVDDSHERH